ncbi:MAG: hypothetical protein Q9195_000591 [Heterodermia aff. obscurata]
MAMKFGLPSRDAWTRARDRYVEDLSKEEKALFENASPEAILYDASAAAKVYTANSKSLNATNKLQPLIFAIEQYGQALDVFANAYPLALSPLWGRTADFVLPASIRVLLHLAREFGKYFERLLEMLARIGDVLPRFRVYENLFSSHERLVQSLSVAYVDIITFCTKSKAVFRHGRRSSLNNLSVTFKLSWKPFERQFGQQIDDFRTHLKNVDKEAALSHMIEAADARAVTLANQQQLEKAKKKNLHRQILEAIPSVDTILKHRKLQDLRYPGTGSWIFEDGTFREWRNSAQSSMVCCHGIPGCGKTVLASTIIDELQVNSPKVRVIYYYCDYSDKRTLQIDRIVGTLLKQFFIDGLVPEEIEAQIPQDYVEGRQLLGARKLIDLVCFAVKSSSPTFVVLDGLDECEKEIRQQMIDLFCHLSKLKDAVCKILILCRDEDQLLNLRTLQGIPRIRITPIALEGDIKSFVTGSVRSRVQSGELRMRNPDLEKEIVTELVNKAHGMFLWVFFQLDDLCEAPSDAMIRQSLRNLPNGLIETYERILNKIAQNAIQSLVARKIFIWTVCAQRPMGIEEAKEAIAFEPSDLSWDLEKIPDEDLMIETCKGLVIRDQGDGTIRFAHHTIRQYLLSEDAKKRNESFACSMEEAELFVGQMCLTYLSFSDFETQVSVKTPESKIKLPPVVPPLGTASWISNLLEVPSSFFQMPYRLLGGNSSTPAPDIDYMKYLRSAPTATDTAVHEKLSEKYKLLGYIIEYWIFYTKHIKASMGPLYRKLHDIARHKQLSFEFRPWGPNQHHGKYGCVSCAPSGAALSVARNLPFMSMLHYAAEAGHWPLMEPLINEYCSHEHGDDETLVIACRAGHLSVVEQLIHSYGFDLSNGKAMIAAAGNEKIFTYLLEAAPIDYPIFNKESESGPLIVASGNGYEAIVETLCRRGAQVGTLDIRTVEIALLAASSNGHDQIVRNLIAKGARISLTWTTPLHRAAENGHHTVFRTLLLAANVDYDQAKSTNPVPPQLVHALDQDGETSLHKACRNGHHAVVETIIDFAPTTGNWDRNGLAAETRGGPYRQQAIHLAALNGHVAVLELLAKHTSIYSRTSNGRTPLMLAAEMGHVPVIRFLASFKSFSHADLRDEDGLAAIDIAVMGGHAEAVKALLELIPELGIIHLENLLLLAARNRQLIPDLSINHLENLLLLAARNRQVLATVTKHYESESGIPGDSSPVPRTWLNLVRSAQRRASHTGQHEAAGLLAAIVERLEHDAQRDHGNKP